ncbi:hypothetical protein HJC23_000453 [Cyclotella cryptica]|uniref:Uncharacterized protein n=1 Tax=Cyclotella cryptica TaxID=29204 RepID=A0ABD3QG10_9STRA
MIPSKVMRMRAVGTLPPAIVSTNNLFHSPAANQTAIAAAHHLLSPSLIRASEILLPHVNFSSVPTKPDTKNNVEINPPSINIPTRHYPLSDPFFSIQHRPFESLFDHLWRTTAGDFPFARYAQQKNGLQIRQLLREMNDLTQSRMDRWMLSPSLELPHSIFGDPYLSLDVWQNAKYDQEKKMWSVPLKVPNIFRNDNISVDIVKDKTANSYKLRIQGRREVENNLETDAIASAPDEKSGDESDTSKLEQSPDVRTGEDIDKVVKEPIPKAKSISDYQYEMEFQLPPLPADSLDMTPQQAMEFYSPITAKFNADEGILTINIPESIVSPDGTVDSKTKEELKDEFAFSVPIESAA